MYNAIKSWSIASIISDGEFDTWMSGQGQKTLQTVKLVINHLINCSFTYV